ncbi:WD40 domain-containing protein denticleless [Oratosquilla oratoria]|uniref:WD40 domain-containing protein denticleless n=1 Tax=Oratosquilla oratoria TaxID=337810 RepID=UPI003F758FDC
MSGMKAYNLHSLLYERTICSSYYSKIKCTKNIFAQGFKSTRDDEYFAIQSDPPEENATYSPIYACRFGSGEKFGHIIVLANEDGRIALQDTRKTASQNPGELQGTQVHSNAIFDVCWVPGKAEVVSVSGDQTAAVWHVADDMSLKNIHSLEGHCRSIKTVHVNPYDPCVLATGGRDGNVIIWDMRCQPSHIADEIAPAHPTNIGKSAPSPGFGRRSAHSGGSLANNSVTAVLFQDEYTLVSAGASDGLMKIWDLRKTHKNHIGGRRDPQCKYLLEHPGHSSRRGFTSLQLSPHQDTLYVSCMDNTIYAYDLINMAKKPVAEYTGHINSTYFVKSCLSPCGSFLLSGSSDSCAYIWLTDSPGKPVAKFTGHSWEVTAVAWCPVDVEKLVTCADDMMHRIFRIKNIDEDDWNMRFNINGRSIPYTSAEGELPTTSDSRECLSHRPVSQVSPSTPSSCPGVDQPVTPGPSSRNLEYEQVTPQIPILRTPKHSNSSHHHNEIQRTPKTSERRTLLHWLAGKTPGSMDSRRDSVSKSPGIFSPISSSKKVTLKRKLSELMGTDQENKPIEEQKIESALAKKGVLLPSLKENIESQSPLPNVAKMLKYDESETNLDKNRSISCETLDSIKPIEGAESYTGRRPITNKPELKSEVHSCRELNIDIDKDSGQSESLEKPISTVSHSVLPCQTHPKLMSPTANLPNFVLDGSSPHNRPEKRMQPPKHKNWLTSFGYQCKLKLTRTPDKRGTTAKRKQCTSTQTVRSKISSKKILKIKNGKLTGLFPLDS